ncbi:hypothetical protein F3Y22_tig00110332pilonHSYRG00803 [Hibiscus syriacus]|uniref:Uncharacterized protein n=1 Tax=Hibiscus syriacus TaxID=106335 RepID=A0A6A3B125_HIBSY|nr:hypothetical protein F3Y22_tig00110332pilonHSYRG00803 [Hibiscus syriacus]
MSSWCKNRWHDSFKSIFDVMLCPLEASVSKVCLSKPLASAWYPSPKELLKFNVDGLLGAALGCGASSCSGCVSSFPGFSLVSSRRLIIESDSSLVFISKFSWKIQYAPREVNGDADALAKSGIPCP